MFCPHCGKESPENSAFCVHCGTQLGVAPPQPQPSPYQPQPPMYSSPEHYQPMKWYKFLIYFLLFASAVVNVLTAITLLTGSIYSSQGVSASMIYDYYGETLKFVDIGYALALIALAVFAVHTRFQLAGFKKGSPTLLYVLYAATTGLTLLYELAVFVLFDIQIEMASMIGSVIGVVIHIWLNSIYFKKREWMFVN